MHGNCCWSGCSKRREAGRRRGPGVIGTLMQLLFAWAILVFAGGTLINTGHPVAVETGRLIHTVTFVEPLDRWAEHRDYDLLSNTVGLLRKGVNVGALT